MPRPKRVEIAGAAYHIWDRGHLQHDIVFDDDDRRTFLRLLKHAVERFQWECLNYCLMDNHYHLVLRLTEPNLGLGMHFLNSEYVRIFKKRHGSRGRFFQDRYKAKMVKDERHLADLVGYVSANPIRARICASASEFRWSGHLEIVGTKPAEIIDRAALATLLGAVPTQLAAIFADPGKRA